MDERGLIQAPQETVSPFQMEAILRGVIKATNGQDHSMTVIPYCLRINNSPSLMIIRRARQEDGEESLSLDMGILDQSSEHFESLGYADIREQSGIRPQDRRTGVIWVQRPVCIEGQVSVSRDKIKDSGGISVHEAVRMLGIGRNLISSARVLLHEVGIDGLLIKEIRTSDGPGGRFYRRLGNKHGGQFIEEPVVDPEYGQGGYLHHMYFSTTNSPEAPYVFGK